MLTIPFRIPSTSASEASLKDTSQTLIIFCKSSSKPISLLSSEISAPWPFIHARSSSACSSRLMSMNTGTFILNKTLFHFCQELWSSLVEVNQAIK